VNKRKPIFYDENRRRWFFTRRALEIGGAVVTVLLLTFFISIFRFVSLPNLIVRSSISGRRPVPAPPAPLKKITPARPPVSSRHRATALGQISAKYDPERSAFYIDDDASSLASLKFHYKDLDRLISLEAHALTADGSLSVVDTLSHQHAGLSGEDAARIANVDKLHTWMQANNIELSVMALVNNGNPDDDTWQTAELVKMLANPAARKKLETNLVNYVQLTHEVGVCLDFEDVPVSSQPHYQEFTAELEALLGAQGLQLVVALPAADNDYDYAFFGKTADDIVLMNYDEHTADPGPIASQSWFVKNMDEVLKVVPPEKIIMGISNYGYDWTEVPKGHTTHESVSVQQAFLTAVESEAQVQFDPDSLNPHYSYVEDNQVHQVWFTDALSAYNQLRAAERKNVGGTAIWRLGMADSSMWAIMDATRPTDADRAKLLDIPPGPDLILEGPENGDIWRIMDQPTRGKRTFRYDAATDTLQDEAIQVYPLSWHIERLGGNSEKKLALTFDDGPDPNWTPKILDVLKEKNVPATFFVIGENANRYPQILKREYSDGNEIGNHTYTHENIEDASPNTIRWQVNVTERLIEASLGVKTVFFRPPYGIDHQPETADEVASLPIPQDMGYMLIGARIDPHDWGAIGGGSPPSTDDIVQRVLEQADTGTIVMFHDGGGDRSHTLAALPRVIDGLRKAGYKIVPVSELVGQTRAQVMPEVTGKELWAARADSYIFGLMFFARVGIATVFILGIMLVSGRALIIGLLALIEKMRPDPGDHPEFQPLVSVLIPAYNEEEVIVRTVTSALAADYPNMEIIVINDGSTDRTGELLQENFGENPRVHIIHQVNGGKPSALVRGLDNANGKIVVTIDADTHIDSKAVSKLVRNFVDPKIGAVAGNVKVGNRTRWLTRWQALEYITSQNMEKRAFDLLNCIPVVPGAIGAWRVEAITAAGGFTAETVAEDTDLTIAIRRAGWRISYDEEAIGYTQAPETAEALMRQRFRWTFGTLQSVYKHRDTIGRWKYGTLGWVALPNIFIFQLLLPLFSPAIDLLFLASLALWGLSQFHIAAIPQIFSTQDMELSVIFFLGFMLIDLIACAIAFALEKNEDWSLLLPLVLQRFYYRQMMYIVLFRALTQAVKGRPVGWRGVEPDQPKQPKPPKLTGEAEPSLTGHVGD
jgi:cellulose synthase/poly-beta-1,6-N-acetylglucosamine synthase-like glycosyltransferase/spore germination protein YaaH/peptidoglycan/xylan/chitin deacetylase (PgdA/CDA1 family)